MSITEDTYWNSRGRYQDKASKLEALIPIMGEVENAEQRPELERFRTASNAYYDLFNNGGWNRQSDIKKFFFLEYEKIDGNYDESTCPHCGCSCPDFDEDEDVCYEYRMYGGAEKPTSYRDEEIYARTEPVMDRIILEAFEAEFTDEEQKA
jgi:hypothetical protein